MQPTVMVRAWDMVALSLHFECVADRFYRSGGSGLLIPSILIATWSGPSNPSKDLWAFSRPCVLRDDPPPGGANVRHPIGVACGLTLLALGCGSSTNGSSASTSTGATSGATQTTTTSTGANATSSTNGGSTSSQVTTSTTTGGVGLTQSSSSGSSHTSGGGGIGSNTSSTSTGGVGPGSTSTGSTGTSGPGTTAASSTGTTASTTSTSTSTTGSTTGSPCGGVAEACCSGTSCASGLACQSATCVQQRTSETGTPCARNSDCQSGICYPVPGGSPVCTAACSSTSDCLPGWTCGAEIGQTSNICQCSRTTEVCDGKDNDCDGIVDNEPAVDDECIQLMGSGQVCEGGACICSVTCGGKCVDPNSDASNCGGCGNACNGECVNGQCSPATAISIGGVSACALLSGGTVECWGGNTGTVPVPIAGLTGVTALSVGGGYNCALLSGGTVECWGEPRYRACPDRGVDRRDRHFRRRGVFRLRVGLGRYGRVLGRQQLWTAGQWHHEQLPPLCVVPPGWLVRRPFPSATVRRARCFREAPSSAGATTSTANSGNTTPGMIESTTPIAVAGLTGATAISVGSFTACALLSGGTAKCWGYGEYPGELGNGMTTNSPTPVAVSGLANATAISVGNGGFGGNRVRTAVGRHD